MPGVPNISTGSAKQKQIDRYRKSIGKKPVKRPKLKKIKPLPMVIERPDNTKATADLYAYAAKQGYGAW